MYSDSVYQWNVWVGCGFKLKCVYCKKSFQAQMRRQINNCEKCGNYIPHFHEDRITKEYCDKHFPKKIEGDEFIWVGSSGDISFIDDHSMFEILETIREYPHLTFFFQTKNPKWFQFYDFPKNVILGITLESNIHYPLISSAPKPWKRAADFYFVCHPRKRVTIEPILRFDLRKLLAWVRDINPEIVYIGYDSRKNNLPEPPLHKVEAFMYELRMITKVKEKLIRKAWDEE